MKNKLFFTIIASTLLITFTSCSTGSNYKSEFGNIQQAGNHDVSKMSNSEIHARIKQAYLDGELTAEQARKAHMQLDVKGHLTAEQIALINRDRLNERHKYETNKERLDIYRDVTQTGSSMIGDINNIKNTIRAIFN
jgi:hypothetical protein